MLSSVYTVIRPFIEQLCKNTFLSRLLFYWYKYWETITVVVREILAFAFLFVVDYLISETEVNITQTIS